jgi:hypothetical protein
MYNVVYCVGNTGDNMSSSLSNLPKHQICVCIHWMRYDNGMTQDIVKPLNSHSRSVVLHKFEFETHLIIIYIMHRT